MRKSFVMASILAIGTFLAVTPAPAAPFMKMEPQSMVQLVGGDWDDYRYRGRGKYYGPRCKGACWRYRPYDYPYRNYAYRPPIPYAYRPYNGPYGWPRGGYGYYGGGNVTIHGPRGFSLDLDW